ncbi:HSF-type DNA-binding-domain-containing protein [Dioszegia hungarica]|uniref:HSF-type DNA-binding-domain-containing protein n=1 Tax=Dioszegia hungarica TaxID=4972 RepID=A0AA38H708_9TREE|nr:HSF-type DNA-binding-domain-containing protein [Dioszegia hungarica]KAI9635380.1 HSF-type DNA-binding-domain-containing protein [Dioszegia hungarica]
MFQVYEHSPPLQLYVNDGQGSPYRGDAKDEICGVDGGLLPGGTGRQPNFLQKLFDFLALDPHPCPDVIYWAADSKQLVIARPDELAKTVLPKLFKHDKISSFGRQLNIYGFARVYPGRQFKDGMGNILDASVWAHPTLHRLSTTTDIAAVKRRAAPKLFRTRRLANGQVVRTRAGPEVERKFREIKEDMAMERRSKHGWGGEARPSQIASYASSTPMVIDYDGQRANEMSQSPADVFEWSSSSGTSWGNVPMLPVEQGFEGDGQVYGDFSPSYESQRADPYRQQLSSITEGVPMAPHIHTSPVPAQRALQSARQFPPSFNAHLASTEVTMNVQHLHAGTHIVQRIAAPAAQNPFAVPHSLDHNHHSSPIDIRAPTPNHQPIGSSPLSFTGPSSHADPYAVSPDTTPPSGFASRELSVYPDIQSWERTGVIDPRWVSPKGTYVFNTPAQTPRAGSPMMVSSYLVGEGESQSWGAPSSLSLTSGVRDSGGAWGPAGAMPPTYLPAQHFDMSM